MGRDTIKITPRPCAFPVIRGRHNEKTAYEIIGLSFDILAVFIFQQVINIL